MALGWYDVQRLKRVESQAEALGFKFTRWVEIGSSVETICLRPKDDCLPHYSRDARLFLGTVEQIEDWLKGITWAREYDSMLKVSDSKKRTAKEQQERNAQLVRVIKSGLPQEGTLGKQEQAW